MTEKVQPQNDSSLLKLPRSSYAELAKIIMAYSEVDKPASLDDISHRCGINKFIVSSNNAFLTAIRIIEGGRTKFITELGRPLGLALAHDISSEIAKAWRTIVERSPYFDKVISAVRIRRFFETSAFESHVAYSSGEPRSSQTMTGARTIVDILKTAEIITEADGKITLGAVAETPGDQLMTPEEASVPKQSLGVTAYKYGGHYSEITIKINININASAGDLQGLGEKIRDVIRQIQEFGETEHD